MGLEALSRGADECVFVDQEAQSLKIVKANLAACGFMDRARLIQMDALSALRRIEGEVSFNVVFLDPPYHKGLVNQTLGLLSDLNLLTPDGIICAEAAKSDEVSAHPGVYEMVGGRNYGSTSVYFFSHPSD